MPFPEPIQSALQNYDREKGFWRRLFGDQATIRKLRRLTDADQTNLFRIYQCFMENLSKPTQASYKVYIAVKIYLTQIDYAEIPEMMSQFYASKLLKDIDLDQINRLEPSHFKNFARIITTLGAAKLLTQQNVASITPYYGAPDKLPVIANLANILIAEDPLNQESFNEWIKLLVVLHDCQLLTQENAEKLGSLSNNISMLHVLNNFLETLQDSLLHFTQENLDSLITNYQNIEYLSILVNAIDKLFYANCLNQENLNLLLTIQPQDLRNLPFILGMLDQAKIFKSDNIKKLFYPEAQFLFSDEAYTLLWRKHSPNNDLFAPASINERLSLFDLVKVDERQAVFDQILIKAQQAEPIEEIKNYLRGLNLEPQPHRKHNDVKFPTAPSQMTSKNRESIIPDQTPQLNRQCTV